MSVTEEKAESSPSKHDDSCCKGSSETVINLKALAAVSVPEELQLREAIEAVVQSEDLSVLSFRQMRRNLEAKFGLSEGGLDCCRDFMKRTLHTCMTTGKGKVVASPSTTSKSNDDAEVAAKKAKVSRVISEMALGPSLYRGLAKEDAKLSVNALEARMFDKLQEMNILPQGERRYPTIEEERVFKRKRQREEAMDGLDVTNIIHEEEQGRQRRGAAVKASRNIHNELTAAAARTNSSSAAVAGVPNHSQSAAAAAVTSRSSKSTPQALNNQSRRSLTSFSALNKLWQPKRDTQNSATRGSLGLPDADDDDYNPSAFSSLL